MTGNLERRLERVADLIAPKRTRAFIWINHGETEPQALARHTAEHGPIESTDTIFISWAEHDAA